jgi:hypothetical protein
MPNTLVTLNPSGESHVQRLSVDVNGRVGVKHKEERTQNKLEHRGCRQSGRSTERTPNNFKTETQTLPAPWVSNTSPK